MTPSELYASSVHHKQITNRLKEMAEHESVKDWDEETVKKDCQKDVQLPAKFEKRRTAFPYTPQMLKSCMTGIMRI